MSARDELIMEIARVLAPAPKSRLVLQITEDGEIAVNVPPIADAILAAGYRKPRTITTTEGLDALPDGSAVIDAEGDISTKHDHCWHSYETAPLMSRRIAKYGPLTVLYEPSGE